MEKGFGIYYYIYNIKPKQINTMKKTLSTIVTLMFIICFSNCSFTQSETNIKVEDFTDSSYKLSKKAIEYALRNQVDSLYLLCDKGSISDKKQLAKVIEEIQTLINIYEYPTDNQVKMNKTKISSILSNDENISTFRYPFENKSDKDDIRWIEVGVKNDLLISLYITIS